MEKMPLKWVIGHQLTFVMALLYVLLDLTNEVSSGTVERAKEYIDKLLLLCNSPITDGGAELAATQEKATFAVCRHLVKEVISPNEHVRKQVGYNEFSMYLQILCIFAIHVYIYIYIYT